MYYKFTFQSYTINFTKLHNVSKCVPMTTLLDFDHNVEKTVTETFLDKN